MDASTAVISTAHPAPAIGTRRLVVTGAVARLVALTALTGNAALMWPLAEFEPLLPAAIAASAVLVLACALGAGRRRPGLDLVAVLVGWLTAWLSLGPLTVNGILTYFFAAEGSEIVCHDLPCPSGPDLLYILVFGACAVAGLVDLGCSVAAVLRALRRTSTGPARVAAGIGAVVGGALMLAAAFTATYQFVA